MIEAEGAARLKARGPLRFSGERLQPSRGKISAVRAVSCTTSACSASRLKIPATARVSATDRTSLGRS